MPESTGSLQFSFGRNCTLGRTGAKSSLTVLPGTAAVNFGLCQLALGRSSFAPEWKSLPVSYFWWQLLFYPHPIPDSWGFYLTKQKCSKFPLIYIFVWIWKIETWANTVLAGATSEATGWNPNSLWKQGQKGDTGRYMKSLWSLRKKDHLGNQKRWLPCDHTVSCIYWLSKAWAPCSLVQGFFSWTRV